MSRRDYSTYDLTPGGTGFNFNPPSSSSRRPSHHSPPRSSRRSSLSNPSNMGPVRTSNYAPRALNPLAPSYSPPPHPLSRYPSIAVGESFQGRERFRDLELYDTPRRSSAGRRPSIFDAPTPRSVRGSMYEEIRRPRGSASVYGGERERERDSPRASFLEDWGIEDAGAGRQVRYDDALGGGRRELPRRLSSGLPSLFAMRDREVPRPSYGGGGYGSYGREFDRRGGVSDGSLAGFHRDSGYGTSRGPSFASVDYGRSFAGSRRSTRDESPLGRRYSRR